MPDSDTGTTLMGPISEYGVLERLGSGSFGETFRVAGPDGTEYALKLLRPGADSDARLRFRNEIWALKALDHRVIPKFVDEGIYEGRPYLVESLARGKPLRKQLEEQRREYSASSQMRVLSITIAVLDALAHMHERGILHRDVKDDNIIATQSVSHVSLIDFGYCKGPGQPADVPSLWNVGAARYSPPDKLEHPTHAHATHDVFAVGVTGYLLLTNCYPWDISQSEDVGHLRQRMETEPLKPISDRNSLVSHEVSDFFATLLQLNDDARPTASAAKTLCEKLRGDLSARLAEPAISGGRQIIFPRVIRDPLHGDIRLTEFEWQVLNCREVQRLRWLRQLGFSNLVYPGAEHTRLHHSIGTMYVADKILRQIEDITGRPFDAEERLMARLYSLVHDVTHICYGHTLEDELGIFERHDRNHRRLDRLLLSDKSQVGNLLRSTDYGREVLAYFDPSSTIQRHGHIRELIEGPTGADVLDYIDRDSYFCGLDHRVDSAIFRQYRLVQAKPAGLGERHIAPRLFGTHGVRLDAEFAIESVFLERFALFLKVYTHPAKTAAGAMLGKAVVQATAGRSPEFDERHIEWIGDSALLSRLAESRRGACKKMAERLLFRELFKAAFRAPALSPEQRHHDQYTIRLEKFDKLGLFDPERRAAAERELARTAGVDSAEVVLYCSQPPGLQKIVQYVEQRPGAAELRNEIHRPYLRTFERHLALWTVYLFTSVDSAGPFSRLGEASEALFGLKNEVLINRRQGLLF
jgi:hypothetical protein